MTALWRAALIGLLALATNLVEAEEAPRAPAHDPTPPPELCRVPDALVLADGRLPAVRVDLALHKPLRIVVVGTASSMGTGVSDPQKAYPERLWAALSRRLPVKVTV